LDSFDSWIRERFTLVKLTREHMHLYQLEAYEFLRDNPFSALFIDMGLGKTVTSLTLATDLLKDFAYGKVLIIGPLRVATETWPTEIATWEHCAQHNYQLIHAFDDDPRLKAAAATARSEGRAQGLSPSQVQSLGQKAETAEKERIRADATRSRKSIHIISRDWVEWLVNFWGAKWPYRCVIIDESSGFKDHASGRFKALAKVRNTPGLIERLHELTATPAAETYEHLFAQMYLMDKGERLGKNITTYRERYFTQNRYSFKWVLRPGAEHEILTKISDICLVMKAEDYLDVAKPVFAPRYVSMDASQQALYDKMEKDFIVQLPDGTEIEAETAAALSQKLLQLASGVLYDTQLVETAEAGQLAKKTTVHRVHEHKLDCLGQIVDESQGEPLLVAYHFKASLERLKARFPNAVVMDKDGKCVKDWNKRKIQMLLIHPQSAGHGLNLQHGGHNLVFFDLPWSLENFLQTIGRLARQGQKRIVVVQPVLCRGTLDEYVFELLAKKEDAQDKLFALLKRLIKRHGSGEL